MTGILAFAAPFMEMWMDGASFVTGFGNFRHDHIDDGPESFHLLLHRAARCPGKVHAVAYVAETLSTAGQ